MVRALFGEFFEALDHFVDGEFTVLFVVACTNVNRAVRFLLLTDDCNGEACRC